jgi:microcystin-dependent protein
MFATPGSRQSAAASVADELAFVNGMVGTVAAFAAYNCPDGWLQCFGQNVSIRDYPQLYDVLVINYPGVTFSGNNAVFSGFPQFNYGDRVQFYTTGALPAPLVAGTPYYIMGFTGGSSNYTLQTSLGAGVITITGGNGSGVHRAVQAPFGNGDGVSTFGIPDLRGRIIAGDTIMGHASNSEFGNLDTYMSGRGVGNVGGSESVVLTIAQMEGHYHPTPHTHAANAGGSLRTNSAGTVSLAATTGANNGLDPTTAASNIASVANAGGGVGHNNDMPILILNYFIFAGDWLL